MSNIIQDTLCPDCGAKMKPAHSKFGTYWRCSRWGCQGTRDVNGDSKDDKMCQGESEVEGRWDRKS